MAGCNNVKRFKVEKFNEITPVPCPCGMSRRAFVGFDGRATFHQVEIRKDAVLHYHKKHFEIYLILEGNGHMELDGELIEVEPGSTVFIQEYCRHRALGPMKIVNISAPAFDPEDEFFD